MEKTENELVSLKSIFVKYLRHWKLFLVVFILSFIPAILYLKLVPRTYKFAAGILLQDDKDAGGMTGLGGGNVASLMKSFGIGSSGGSAINVEDEIEILNSNRLLRLMIHELGLHITYSKPWSLYQMYHEAPLKLTADSTTFANLQDEVKLQISVAPGKIKVKAGVLLSGWKGVYTFSSLPATFKVGTDDFTLDFDHDGAAQKTFKLNIKCQPAGWMAETIGKNIEIEDVSSSSNVLLLTCQEHSRQRGLDILNSLIRNYNEDMESYQKADDLKTMTFVNNRIALILDDLTKVEDALQDFKKKNEITLPEADMALYGENYTEIQKALIEGEMKVREVELLDAYIKDPENRYKAIPSVFTIEEGEKGTVSMYNKAILTREKLLSHSNELNMMYQSAHREVEILRESVQTMVDNARENASKTVSGLKAKEKQLMSTFRSFPEKEREYITYVRDQEICQGIYLLMLQKKEETILSLNKQTDRARLIEPPIIMRKPVAPRKLYACIGILVLTIVVPIGYLFTKDLVLSIIEEFKHT